MSPAGSDRSRTHQNGVRGGSQEAHDEPVWLEPAADFATTRGADSIERDNTIERRDEVGGDRRSIGSETD
jgi:hypothetical protein